jgi:hypothetical protein
MMAGGYLGPAIPKAKPDNENAACALKGTAMIEGVTIASIITLLIAAFVAVIGFFNWRVAALNARTARDKLALDLFDRRMKVYKDVRLIVSYGGARHLFRPGGGAKDNFPEGLPNEVIADGRFIFGDDMVALLEKVHSFCTLVDTGDPHASGNLNSLFTEKMIPLFNEYMRMEAKPASRP